MSLGMAINQNLIKLDHSKQPVWKGVYQLIAQFSPRLTQLHWVLLKEIYSNIDETDLRAFT